MRLSHVLHSADFASLNLWSAPHSEHAPAPASAYVPAAHSVLTLDPSHAMPAVHATHPDRVVGSPPTV
jgi:hypothetical protein